MDSLSSILAVLFVLALLAALLAFLRKRGAATFHLPGLSGAKTRHLEVLERVVLGPQHTIHLVRIGGRAVVVATAPGGCHVLLDREDLGV